MDDQTMRPKATVMWTLREDTVMDMLQRCYSGGETPDEVYLEMYVNLYVDNNSEPGR